MAEVEIEYCVPCGFRERAIDVQRAVLNGVESDLDRVVLRMGDHGVFRVTLDGDPIYEKSEDEYDVDGIVREIRERL
jgi:selenoprotein W-related protein